MIPVCDYCTGWIERSNRAFTGFCSPSCRDAARRYLEGLRRKLDDKSHSERNTHV